MDSINIILYNKEVSSLKSRAMNNPPPEHFSSNEVSESWNIWKLEKLQNLMASNRSLSYTSGSTPGSGWLVPLVILCALGSSYSLTTYIYWRALPGKPLNICRIHWPIGGLCTILCGMTVYFINWLKISHTSRHLDK